MAEVHGPRGVESVHFEGRRTYDAFAPKVTLTHREIHLSEHFPKSDAVTAVVPQLSPLPKEEGAKRETTFFAALASAIRQKMRNIVQSLSQKIASSRDVGFIGFFHQISPSLGELKRTVRRNLFPKRQKKTPEGHLTDVFRQRVDVREQDPEQRETKVLLGTLQRTLSGKRKILRFSHDVEGVTYGTETAVPIETKDLNESSLKIRKSALEDKKKQLLLMGADTKDIDRKLTVVQHALDAPLVTKDQSVGSLAVRKAFGEGQDVFLTTIVNGYRQEIRGSDGKKKGSLLRFGAITDWGKGLTSLNELREAKGRCARLKETTAKKRGIIQRVLRAFRVSKRDLSEKQKLAIENTKRLFDDVGFAVLQREFLLQQQMLFVLQNQLEENVELVTKDGQSFPIGHVSLLNPGKKEFDSNGFAHYEQNEMLDTHDAFEMFNGKEILLDEKSTIPYIDADDRVHIPRPKNLSSTVSSVKIETCFFNVSVQGHRVRDLKKQREVDAESFIRLRRIMEERISEFSPEKQKKIRMLFERCQKEILAGKSSYKLAEDISTVFTFLKIPFSLNCFSGKDRTGYVASRAIAICLQEQIGKTVTDSKKAKRIKEKIGSRGFDPLGVSSQITEVNTGSRWLKVSPFVRTPGITTAVSVAQRVISAIGAGIGLIGGNKETKV